MSWSGNTNADKNPTKLIKPFEVNKPTSLHILLTIPNRLHQSTWTQMAWLDHQRSQLYKPCSLTPCTQGEGEESFSIGIKYKGGCFNQHPAIMETSYYTIL